MPTTVDKRSMSLVCREHLNIPDGIAKLYRQAEYNRRVVDGEWFTGHDEHEQNEPDREPRNPYRRMVSHGKNTKNQRRRALTGPHQGA